MLVIFHVAILFLIVLPYIVPLKLRMSGQIFVCTNKWCREKGSDAVIANESVTLSLVTIALCLDSGNIHISDPIYHSCGWCNLLRSMQ